MGTRALVIIEDETGKHLATLYNQYDGYPEGLGVKLFGIAGDGRLVNGLRVGDESKQFNGMGCLAASVVAALKDGPGNVYMVPEGTADVGEEWVYSLYPQDGQIMLRVMEGCVTFFGLPGTDRQNMPTRYNGFLAQFTPEQCKPKDGEPEPPNDFLAKQAKATATN